jgi:undecaprenyl-diphosphatase
MISRIRRIQLHSYHVILLLFFALTFGSLGIGFLVQQNPLLLSFDSSVYLYISNLPRNPFIDFLIRPTNENFLPGPMPSFLFPLVFGSLLYLGIFNRKLFLPALFCFIFGTILAMAITALDWHFVFRDRPFLTLPSQAAENWKEIWKGFSSFPSGHARETTVYCTIIARFIPRLKYLLIFFVLLVAFSRVYLGAHFPTDVFAGMLIGYLTAITTIRIELEIERIIKNLKGIYDAKSKV